MGPYILRRVLVAIPLLLVTSIIVFAFLHLAPGSPESALLGGRNVNEQTLESIREQYHLNDPVPVQYLAWLEGVLTGDLGDSVRFRDSVASVIGPRILPTVQLATYALLLVIAIALPLGIASGVRKGSKLDHGVSGLTLLASSISPYLSGIVLIAVFSVALGWFPVFGIGDSTISDRLYHLTLPAVALAVSLIALLARNVRAALAQTMSMEYIETARSRGLRESRIVRVHGLRGALIPVVTISGLLFGYLLSGTVLVEYTFGLNGLGSLLVDSVTTKDFAVVQAVTLLFTATFILVNLAVDIIYVYVDPRVRLGGSEHV